MRQLLITAGLLLPLGLDTFALGAALGVAGLARQDRLRVALVLTAFEAGMPVVGLLAGRALGSAIGAWAGYGGIAFLVLTGIQLLRSSGDEAAEGARLKLLARARGVAILDLGLGISVDELTVGFSAGLLGISILLAVAWIAVQAFAATQVGFRLGGRLGEGAQEGSEKLAGIALLAVAAVLLILRVTGL